MSLAILLSIDCKAAETRLASDLVTSPGVVYE
jgi:hypothetical protein